MTEYTREFCEQYADRLIAADEPERLRLIWAMADTSVVEDAPGFIIVTGLAVRDRGRYDLATYVFQVAAAIPKARHSALFEEAVNYSLQGRPERAAQLLREAEALQPLNAYQQRAFAHQLGRLGDRAGTRARLESSFLMDPGSFQECLAIEQLFDYMAEFPAADATRRAEALRTLLPTRSNAEVADDITDALAAGRPYSLLRVNDGEGAFLHLSLGDESRYAALYRRNRIEWHGVIFGNADLLYDPYWLSLTRRFSDNLWKADCLGADQAWGIPGEYAWASIRNVPCLFNIVRKFEQMDAAGELARKPISLCNPQINQHLLTEGHLERIIGSQKRIGLISAHAALPGALQRKFGLEEVVYHQTSGEAKVAAAKGQVEPLQVWHERICAALEQSEPGMLWIVCAGMMSKIYCEIIKDAGGVGLDVGAVADIWMRAPTRGHSNDPGIQALGLVEA